LRAGLERDFDVRTMTEHELVGDDGCHVSRQQSSNI
jgi:hypothetical protein